jgi:transposase InsO family protein
MLMARKGGQHMPWRERSVMSERLEFVQFASQEDVNLTALCQRFGISRTTGYKWLERYSEDGLDGLEDQSRRPQHAPGRTSAAMEAQVLALRDQRPAWGGRKLYHRLRELGHHEVPSPSTITAILRRHGRLATPQRPQRDLVRFEHPEPNDLLQLDFMGHLALERGRVHPLTLLDDHSRFSLALIACDCEQQALVQVHLRAVFARYGLPRAILTDNGPPWGDSGAGGLTALEVWFIRLGIRVRHGRPRHPQTQGKVERWHRTIHAEVFRGPLYRDLAACQVAFDAFRHTYNLERPHAALEHAVPASRYQPSPRPFPATLPPIAYGPDDLVRKVNPYGIISVRSQRCFIGRGLAGMPVAVRPTTTDGRYTVHFCEHTVTTIDLRQSDEV